MLYLENGDHILSQEGVTQGDNAAMAMYTRPLIQALCNETANDEVKQVWYADDSSAVGSLAGVKKWREYLQANGPDFGYCPKPAKTILLIKDSSLMQAAQKIFKDDGIKISDQGERLLGSVIEKELFREQYIKNKVESGVKDVQSLSKYAQDDPQATYSAFTKGLSSRWTHFQRTVPDASELFEPLENAIRDQLIPALLGREVSDVERQILALPIRHGGLGLIAPRETAKTECEHSTQITNNLTAKIYTQTLDLDYNPSDQQFTRHTKNRIRQEKNEKCKNIRDELLAEMTPESQQLIKRAMVKGASSWLLA